MRPETLWMSCLLEWSPSADTEGKGKRNDFNEGNASTAKTWGDEKLQKTWKDQETRDPAESETQREVCFKSDPSPSCLLHFLPFRPNKPIAIT